MVSESPIKKFQWSRFNDTTRLVMQKWKFDLILSAEVEVLGFCEIPFIYFESWSCGCCCREGLVSSSLVIVFCLFVCFSGKCSRKQLEMWRTTVVVLRTDTQRDGNPNYTQLGRQSNAGWYFTFLALAVLLTPVGGKSRKLKKIKKNKKKTAIRHRLNRKLVGQCVVV